MDNAKNNGSLNDGWHALPPEIDNADTADIIKFLEFERLNRAKILFTLGVDPTLLGFAPAEKNK